MSHCGIVNLNKPSGITSRRALDVVKRLARPAKAGHAGTLDPLAEGVLVVCLGPATRLIKYIQQSPKCYRGTFLLGRKSQTEDIEGTVVELPDAPVPTLERICAAARRFVGQIAQRPPSFSALKINGRRAYDLARRGEQVQLPARPVNVYRLDVVAYEYPELVLDIECSAGTYIRSLGRDLAESLGSAAVMSALIRTAVGDFRIEHSVAPDVLKDGDWTDRILPPLLAVGNLPVLQFAEEELARIRSGQYVDLRREGNETRASKVAGEAAAIDAAGRLAAIVVCDGGGLARAKINLSRSASA